MKNSQKSFTEVLNKKSIMPWLAVILAVSAVLSICFGTVMIPAEAIFQTVFGKSVPDNYRSIILYSRLPRTIGCLLAGAALSVSGCIIQAVLANPLASASIIGVNAGASVAVAVLCAAVPTAVIAVSAAAFCGAMIAVLLVFSLSNRAEASRMTTILAGVAISAICSALTEGVITFAPTALAGYTDFRIGSLSGVSFRQLIPAAIVILPCLVISCTLTNELNVLSLGSDTAASLGLSVHFHRILELCLAAALASAAVSFCGMISFLGLLIPHFLRRMGTTDYSLLIPAGAIAGAAVLCLCDCISRLIFVPYELPVGIIFSLMGGSFFLWLLLEKKEGHRHD